MPHWRKMLKNTIAAVEFEGAEPTIKITKIRMEELFDPKTQKTKQKLTAHFQGSARGWVLNGTNCELMEKMFGTGDFDQWVGREVTLCSAMVPLGKDTVPGIRVKGSPELKAPIKVALKQGKRVYTVTLVPTGKDAPHSEYREERASKLQDLVDAAEVEQEGESDVSDAEEAPIE